MNITYFVHSVTQDNEKGLATGWLPGALSADGIIRAQKVATDIAGRSFDAVFCSDLARAIHSTDIFFGQKFPVFIDWRLRECNYGTLDGQPATTFKKNREQEYITTPYPNGESYHTVEQRMRRFIADAQTLFPNGHIAIVAHQAPQLALDVIVKDLSWEQAIHQDWRKTGAWQAGWEYYLK